MVQRADHYQLSPEVFHIFSKISSLHSFSFPPLSTQNLPLNHSVKAREQCLIYPNIIQNEHTQFHFIIICNKDHFSVKHTQKQNLMLI